MKTEDFYKKFIESATTSDFNENVTYKYLVETKQLIEENPDRIRMVDDPTGFLQMIDYAIEHWNTPNRDKALTVLAANETQINKIYKSEIQEHQKDKLFFTELKKATEKGGNKFLFFNPLVVAARNGFLIALMTNYRKLAERLKWGYKTKAETMENGFTEADWNNSKKAVSEIEKIYSDFGGSATDLKNAVFSYNTTIINTLSLGDPATAATIAAAAPVIIAAIGIMAKNKSKTNPDDKNKSSDSDSDDDE